LVLVTLAGRRRRRSEGEKQTNRHRARQDVRPLDHTSLRLLPRGLLALFVLGCGEPTSGISGGSGGVSLGGGAGSSGVGAVATGGAAGTGASSGKAGSMSADGGNAGSSFESGGVGGKGAFAPDPCVAAGTCPPGVWTNVSPSNVVLPGENGQACANYGTLSVQNSPLFPEVMFAEFNCQGIWKSTDYGMTWNGPINVGENGSTMADCQGGLAAAPNAASWNLYESCIGGGGYGFWASTNSGVDWTSYKVVPGGDRQDFYPPSIDPYDPNHLLMAGHEMNLPVQSEDGGKTWTSIAIDSAMNAPGGSAAFVFIDTGNATTTRNNWLYSPQATGGMIGTWRTTDGGASWKQVDKNEKEHSYYQIFQPDTNGVVFMAGVYSALGNGVLRSTDYGQTWAHVGLDGNRNIVFGTSKRVYALDAYSAMLGEVADLPGTGTWQAMSTPWSGISPSGPIAGTGQAAVTSDGTYAIIVTANWNGGLWRYVEPLN
jgi:hypothetical protein